MHGRLYIKIYLRNLYTGIVVLNINGLRQLVCVEEDDVIVIDDVVFAFHFGDSS